MSYDQTKPINGTSNEFYLRSSSTDSCMDVIAAETEASSSIGTQCSISPKISVSADNTQHPSYNREDILDEEGLSLLAKIFPDATREELKETHFNRIKKVSYKGRKNTSAKEKNYCTNDADTANRLFPSKQQEKGQRCRNLHCPLEEGSLFNSGANMEVEMKKQVIKLENEICREHIRYDARLANEISFRNYERVITVVFSRDIFVGFGMQLRESDGYVFVHALICHDRTRIASEKSYSAALDQFKSNAPLKGMGPAFKAGVKPGDMILGVNGVSFLRWMPSTTKPNSMSYSSQDILESASEVVTNSTDPIHLHLYRLNPHFSSHFSLFESPSKSTSSGHHQQVYCDVKTKQSSRPEHIDSSCEILRFHTPDRHTKSPVQFHPLSELLGVKGLLQSRSDKLKFSRTLEIYNERARQWESNIHVTSGLDNSCNISQHDLVSSSEAMHVDRYGNLMHVRKALCVHIVNTFVENDRLAYIMWVFDIESQMEWYAPIRYLQDFEDLRDAVSQLRTSYVNGLPFPNLGWFHGKETYESERSKDTRCNQLETFLRDICAIAYKDDPNPNMPEVADYIHAFLGCDTCIDDEGRVCIALHGQGNCIDMSHRIFSQKATDEERKGTQLKALVQLYVYRLFLLPMLRSLVDRFVEEVRTGILNGQNENLEKKQILLILTKIASFISQIQDLIFEGCLDDLHDVVMCTRSNNLSGDDTFDKEALYYESIREQVEIEVYVPLRYTISRHLVHGWRKDDAEIKLKMQILKERPQSFFNINSTYASPTDWKTVVNILTISVSRTTLPCSKLHGIVEASKEISRLSMAEHSRVENEHGNDRVKIPFGADDFLPIFIFCVVRAEIERPCALCILLRNLCDPRKQSGEIGYYLSSFESAVIHIRSMDLTAIDMEC